MRCNRVYGCILTLSRVDGHVHGVEPPAWAPASQDHRASRDREAAASGTGWRGRLHVDHREELSAPYLTWGFVPSRRVWATGRLVDHIAQQLAPVFTGNVRFSLQ